MKNKGFSLLELIIGIILMMIILFALTPLFLIEQRFRTAVQGQVASAEEARVAVAHMEGTLRFAIPLEPTAPITIADGQITATIQGGRVDLIPVNTRVTYALDGSALTYTVGEIVITIANNIASFVPVLQHDNEIDISLTSVQGDNTITLQTTIRALGELR